MIALMYDGLELGKFYQDGDKLRLKLNENVKRSWLPYIFDIGFDCDMNDIINAWIKERVFPSNRLGNKRILNEIGLKKYDIKEIAKKSRCSVITDPYWIVYDENDRYSTHSVRGQQGEENYNHNSLGLVDEENYIWRV